MRYGLKEQTIGDINKIFSHYSKIEKVVLFGSRAKGNYKDGSDIDLAIIGDDVTLQLLHGIEDEIDDLFLPYKVDMIIYKNIKSDELKDHINRVGEEIYPQK